MAEPIPRVINVIMNLCGNYLFTFKYHDYLLLFRRQFWNDMNSAFCDCYILMFLQISWSHTWGMLLNNCSWT